MHEEVSGSHTKGLKIVPIGLIHTHFNSATGTPVQATASHDARGIVEVFPEFISGLRDLAEFERLWLIYLLDRACEVRLIVRPYLDTVERGVFATRSPARPNHLGMSAVRLLGVEQNRLLIADVDMLDGSPLLDIKPYIPAFDSFGHARSGWYANKSAADVVADERFERRP